MEKWTAGPVEMYTGQAQKAMYLLRENPVLFEAALEEELEALQEQREEEDKQRKSLEENPAKDTLALRQRMSEVRENERIRVVTELMYLKVCGKFKQLEVPLIPTLQSGVRIDDWGTLGLDALLSPSIYSKDALDLVREHLFKIVGGGSFMGNMMVLQISLLQVGQVYLMSSLFGYYLRKVDARFQLEKLAGNFGAWGDESPSDDTAEPFAEDESASKTLKEYIKSFGPDEMQRMTNVASAEATRVLESQVLALFGDLRALREKFFTAIGPVVSDEEGTQKLEKAVQSGEIESVRLSSDQLRRLVLEAVAFGALLNDAEKQVDSLYELTPSMSRPSALMSDDDEGRMLPE